MESNELSSKIKLLTWTEVNHYTDTAPNPAEIRSSSLPKDHAEEIVKAINTTNPDIKATLNGEKIDIGNGKEFLKTFKVDLKRQGTHITRFQIIPEHVRSR